MTAPPAALLLAGHLGLGAGYLHTTNDAILPQGGLTMFVESFFANPRFRYSFSIAEFGGDPKSPQRALLTRLDEVRVSPTLSPLQMRLAGDAGWNIASTDGRWFSTLVSTGVGLGAVHTLDRELPNASDTSGLDEWHPAFSWFLQAEILRPFVPHDDPLRQRLWSLRVRAESLAYAEYGYYDGAILFRNPGLLMVEGACWL